MAGSSRLPVSLGLAAVIACFALPGAERPVRVEALFKTFPLQPDAAAFVLARWP